MLEHYEMLGSNLNLSCARQISYVLYYCSDPDLVFVTTVFSPFLVPINVLVLVLYTLWCMGYS